MLKDILILYFIREVLTNGLVPSSCMVYKLFTLCDGLLNAEEEATQRREPISQMKDKGCLEVIMEAQVCALTALGVDD